MKTLLIDDCRDLNADIIARNYYAGIFALTNHKWDMLLLDHDLSSYDENGNEKTGYHIICFLEENPQHMPKEIQIVSSNPSGRARMQVVINKWKDQGILK